MMPSGGEIGSVSIIPFPISRLLKNAPAYRQAGICCVSPAYRQAG